MDDDVQRFYKWIDYKKEIKEFPAKSSNFIRSLQQKEMSV